MGHMGTFPPANSADCVYWNCSFSSQNASGTFYLYCPKSHTHIYLALKCFNEIYRMDEILTYLNILPRVNSILLKSGRRSGSSSQQFFISMYSCIRTKRRKEGGFGLLYSIMIQMQLYFINRHLDCYCKSLCLVALLPRSLFPTHRQRWGPVWRRSWRRDAALCRASLKEFHNNTIINGSDHYGH